MNPTDEDYWRALILYGLNQSTYKIALGKLLGDYAYENRVRIDLDDLTSDFIDIYIDRCKQGKPQLSISGRKTYVEREVEAINLGIKSKSDSIEIIKKNILILLILG